jgi:hypothetical protein
MFEFFGKFIFVHRFLQPHQRQVTRVLQFSAQATHELVPPEIVEPVLKTIANNFITERNSSDVMAIGFVWKIMSKKKHFNEHLFFKFQFERSS